MQDKLIELSKYKCLRCDHEWFPRSNEYPRACPKCHSAWWDREPKNNRGDNGDTTKP